MALSAEELKRRVKSARELAGLDQREIGARMKADGLGRHDVGKWERLDPSAPPMSPARAQSLATHTGVPPAWFTEPDLPRLFGAAPAQTPEMDRLWETQQAMLEILQEHEVQLGGASARLAEQLRTNSLRLADRPTSSEDQP